MNVLKLANPAHAVREAVGLAGTVVGAAETAVSRTVDAGRAALHGPRPAALSDPLTDDAPAAGPQPALRSVDTSVPGADTVHAEPQPPTAPPVDVVGEALSGQEGPVTEGGAVVEPSAPVLGEEPGDEPVLDPAEAKAIAADQETLRRAAE